MRIDKFLKVSRLIKRRTVANEVADAGRILVNGRPVKASYAVKEGDEIEIAFGNTPFGRRPGPFARRAANFRAKGAREKMAKPAHSGAARRIQ